MTNTMTPLQPSTFRLHNLNNLMNQLLMNIDQQDNLNNYSQKLKFDRKDNLNMLMHQRLMISPLDKSCIFYPAYKDLYKRNNLPDID
jgi:hypothetical protein